jgi:hypothetical protein
MFNTEVVILKVDVEVRKNQAIFNELPHDASHLVAIEFNYGIEDFDFSSHEGVPACSSGYTGTCFCYV